MSQINSYNRKPGQILLIFIIALAILSIFVVVIAINVRRDSVETAQNEQYEAFYSLAEEKLLKFISGESLTDECVIGTVGNNYSCEIAYEGTTVQLELTETITNDFQDYPLKKDKTLKIGLGDGNDSGYQGNIYFAYTGTADWNISIDYINSKGVYSVTKLVYRNPDAPVYYEIPSNDCTLSEISGGYVRFNINECIVGSDTNGGQALALRLKPITNDEAGVTISLYGDADLPGQMRILEAVTNVAEQSNIEGNTPRIVLQIMQPLHESPIEILDYVLRSETDVDK